MIGNEKFSWKKRARSFVYAWKGLKALFNYEHNARIHLVATLLAIGCGFFFGISPLEWCVVIGCIGCVISAEAVNSALEAIADKVSPDYDPLIGRAKDLGAAAVMVLAAAAVIIGCIVFLPKFIDLIL